jgi:predicted N-acetyltransferase YhbS
MPIIVARRDGKVVGYVLATSMAVKANVAIVQAMLRSFPPPPQCYLYGPVCVADSERGNGLAGAMFEELKAQPAPRLEYVGDENYERMQDRKHRSE